MGLEWEDLTESDASERCEVTEWADEEGDDAAEEAPAEQDAMEAEMEAVRIDRHDGRPYPKREFIECYGNEEEWERGIEVGQVPWACSYCGVTDVSSVLQCDRTGKWFCNGSHGTPGCSHVVLHLVLSKHNTISVHEESKMSGISIACCVCENRNVFSLGQMPHATEPDATVIVCREPCLESGSPLIGDPSGWSPIVLEKRFPEWLSPAPETRPSHKPAIRDVRRLEEAWQTSPEATIRSLDKADGGPDSIPLHFTDGNHFREVMGPFVKLEAAEDKKACDAAGLRRVDVQWDASGRGTFTFYQGDSVTLGVHDRVKLETDSGWEEIYKVSRLDRATRGAHTVHLTPLASAGKGCGTTPAGPYHLSLVWNAMSFKRQEEALRRFAESESACSERVYHALLGHGDNAMEDIADVPSDVGRVPGLPELNHSQVAAISSALRQPLSLIQGPPGTGKTTTSAAVAYRLARQHGKLLACCPSNIAADHLADRVSKTGLKVVRLMSRAKEASSEGAASNASHLHLHNQLRCLAESAPHDTEMSFLIRRRDNGQGLLPNEEGRLHGMLRKCQGDLLASADVVVTTCSSAADHRISHMRFPGVLVDEATQATEPEALIPVTLGCQQLVLIGDHCQLGPVVMNLDAKSRKYNRSLFERMVCLGVVPEKLVVQYRMHPTLSLWPSGAFYDGALQNGVTEQLRQSDPRISWLRTEHPILFVHETSPEQLGGSGTSYINPAEASIVEKNVLALLAASVPPSSIGVITPYDGQRGHILGRFERSRQAGLAEVEVASVDAFQGREKAYIVFSCVRSNEAAGLGFLSDPRRLNVALTRAQRGLVVVGNATSLGRNYLWHSLLQHLSDLDVICTGNLLDGVQRCGVTIPDPRPPPREQRVAGWSTAAEDAGGDAGVPNPADIMQTSAPGIPDWIERVRDADVISQAALSDRPTSSSGRGPPSLISASTFAAV